MYVLQLFRLFGIYIEYSRLSVACWTKLKFVCFVRGIVFLCDQGWIADDQFMCKDKILRSTREYKNTELGSCTRKLQDRCDVVKEKPHRQEHVAAIEGALKKKTKQKEYFWRCTGEHGAHWHRSIYGSSLAKGFMSEPIYISNRLRNLWKLHFAVPIGATGAIWSPYLPR